MTTRATDLAASLHASRFVTGGGTRLAGLRLWQGSVVHRRRATAAAGGVLFVVLVGVAWLGADHPPPSGLWAGVGLIGLWTFGVA